jgi:hypothetical protein
MNHRHRNLFRNNVPGWLELSADPMYKYLHSLGEGTGFGPKKKMPPIASFTGKRSRVSSGTSSFSAPVRTLIRNEDGALNVMPIVSRYGSKGAIKKHRVKHVSRAFKKAVEAASAPDKYHGTKTDIFFATLANVPKNTQAVNAFSETTPGSYSKWAFLPEYFIDAVSVLFAKKAPSANNMLLTSTGNMGDTVLPVQPGSTNGFALKFKVVNSWEKYEFKNNTTRIVIMDLYECAPKKPSYLSTSPISLTSVVGTAGALDAIIDPATYWSKCLADQQALGLNVSGTVKEQYGLSPSGEPDWTKVFKHNKTTVVLEPGTTYEYFMQGPNDYHLDVGKHYSAGYFQSIQKYSRFLLPVVKFDLATQVGTGVTDFVGRARHTNSVLAVAGAGNYVGYQRTLHCKVEMPEMTGFAYPASIVAGDYQALGYRRNAWCINTWDLGVDGSEIRDMTQQTNQFGAE